VALSLGSLPAGVTRRLVTVEPGLSSTFLRRPRPPDHLVRGLCDGWERWGQAVELGYSEIHLSNSALPAKAGTQIP